MRVAFFHDGFVVDGLLPVAHGELRGRFAAFRLQRVGVTLLGRCGVAGVCEAHAQWYEITFVLSSDGFGVVVYVPKTCTDATLLALRDFVPGTAKSTKAAPAKSTTAEKAKKASSQPDKPSRTTAKRAASKR